MIKGIDMNNFKSAGNGKSKCVPNYTQSFSCLTPLPSTNSGRKVYSSSWGDFVAENVEVDVRCDLTLRKCIETTSSNVCGVPEKRYKTYITEDSAYKNIEQFCDRLNYASYKHAYNRYGKRLDVVSAVEGGDMNLRENAFIGDKNKRMHAHLLLQRPKHIDYETFKTLIEHYWITTPWGYIKMQIEEIRTIKGSAKYNAKSTLDGIDLANTYYNDSVLCN